MGTTRRRKQLLELLVPATKPITGTTLADRFGVSRQVIVQDIALLRAQGHEITATPQGYVYERERQQGIRRTFACRHDNDLGRIAAELNTMVDHGGKVLDVIVEHPLYGELRGLLMLRSRHDVSSFVEQLRQTGAEPLLVLTDGVHLHTVEANSEAVFRRISAALSDLDILLSADEAETTGQE